MVSLNLHESFKISMSQSLFMFVKLIKKLWMSNDIRFMSLSGISHVFYSNIVTPTQMFSEFHGFWLEIRSNLQNLIVRLRLLKSVIKQDTMQQPFKNYNRKYNF